MSGPAGAPSPGPRSASTGPGNGVTMPSQHQQPISSGPSSGGATPAVPNRPGPVSQQDLNQIVSQLYAHIAGCTRFFFFSSTTAEFAVLGVLPFPFPCLFLTHTHSLLFSSFAMLHFIPAFISQALWPLINTQNKCDNIYPYFDCWLPQTRTIYQPLLNFLVGLDLACALHALNVLLRALYPKLELPVTASPSGQRWKNVFPSPSINFTPVPLPIVLSNTYPFLLGVPFFLSYYPSFAAAIQRTMAECPVGWEPAAGGSSESEESNPEDEKAARLNQIVGSLSKRLAVLLCSVFEICL